MNSMKNLKGFRSNIGNDDVDLFSSKEHSDSAWIGVDDSKFVPESEFRWANLRVKVLSIIMFSSAFMGTFWWSTLRSPMYAI